MTTEGVWITRGFEAFRQGEFGNAGHNLYVSRAGLLQRIHQYDFTGNGYLDLVFCNSQDHYERVPAYLYADPYGANRLQELPAEGAMTGLLADLNGDGYPDLILGMGDNGIRRDLNAIIYYGSPAGFSENVQYHLPAPLCSAIAAGDFNGDGQVDLAFLCRPDLAIGKQDSLLRVFYQNALTFEPRVYADVEIAGDQMAAADLDGDGYCDLVVRDTRGEVRVYWGGPDGLSPARCTPVPVPVDPVQAQAAEPSRLEQYAEWVKDATPLVQIMVLGGRPHLFVPRSKAAFFAPLGAGRTFGVPWSLPAGQALSAALADLDGDGWPDLALACREPAGAAETSWVYWGGPQGFEPARCSPLPSAHASDVVAGDLDGDGRAEVALCQGHSEEWFTTESLVYRVTPAGGAGEPLRLQTHDARRVLLYEHVGQAPALIFVNHYSRSLLGDIDATIYTGGPEGFSPQRRLEVAGWGVVEAVCCDLNDDGLPDLALANASENSVWRDPGSYVIYNTPAGLPHAPALTLPTQRAHCVCCADLNRDGYLDLIFDGFDNPDLTIVYGTAGGGFDTEHPVRIHLEHEGKTYSEPRWMYLADLNNDGWLDLVVADIVSERSLILWGGPEGFSLARCQALSVWHASCARAADLNNDGYLDLIVGGHTPSRNFPPDSFVYIYWNGPDGLREDRRCQLPASSINSLTVADFNNDGLLDIFICSYHDDRQRDIDSYIYWNRPGKGFSAADRTRLFTHSASGCVAADFNEDGWVDLAVANHKVDGDHKGYSCVFWNGPEGFSEDRCTHLPTSGPHGMVAVGPGNLMDRGPEEYYISAPFHLPVAARPTRIDWEAELPVKAWVRAQWRWAQSPADLAEAAWLGGEQAGGWLESGQELGGDAPAGAWMQYRLALGARQSGRSPRVREVSVHYR